MATINLLDISVERTLQHVPIAHKDILEVGCGDGRLTFEYAEMARKVVAIDPKAGEVERAKKRTPTHLSSKLQFHVGKGESLRFRDESFHLVLFTYSLCCISASKMRKALEESWRVLRPGGFLVDMHPSSDSGNRDANDALKYVTQSEGLFRPIAAEEFTDESHGKTMLTVMAKEGMN